MVANTSLNEEDRQLEESTAVLEQRGILRGPDGYTSRQLAAELQLRGWQLEREAGRTRAIKAYTSTGTVDQALIVRGNDELDMLTILLSLAIRFDERVVPPDAHYGGDLLVRGPDGWPLAVVEVRNRHGLTAEIATAFRRNLLSHNLVSDRIPFFLVVSQDAGYLWNQHPGRRLTDPPDAEFPMSAVINHYAPWFNAADERLSGGSLESVVANWLGDQAASSEPELAEATAKLSETGFLEALKGASVSFSDRQ